MPHIFGEAIDGATSSRRFGEIQRVRVSPHRPHEASIHADRIYIILRRVYAPRVVIDPVCVVQRL